MGKYKNIFSKAVVVTGMFLLGIGIGMVGTYKYAHKYFQVNSFKTTVQEPVTEKLVTDKIAVVNLDEGVTVGEEEINYAGKLLVELPDNFLFTGLEDARSGFGNGLYAGYLVIPATFSKSVVSLNDTPIRAEISYIINNDLAEDVKEEVIYDVLEFIASLNDDISYIYVHSVLDELHDAQDDAEIVMQNDLEEKEAIDAIKANDLVALVPVTELTEVEYNIEPVDISDYISKNAELTGQIGTKYSEYLMESEGEHQKLNEEATALMTEMGNMDGIITDVDLTVDAEGNSVYQTGQADIETLLNEHNTGLKEKQDNIGENVLNIYGDIQVFLTEYDKAVAAYEKENEEKYLNTLTALEELFEEYKENYMLMTLSEYEEITNTVAKQNEQIIEQQNIIDNLRAISTEEQIITYQEEVIEEEEVEEEELEEESEVEEEKEVKEEEDQVTDDLKLEDDSTPEEEMVDEEQLIESGEELLESKQETSEINDLQVLGVKRYRVEMQSASGENDPQQLEETIEEEEEGEEEEENEFSALQKEMQEILDANYYVFSGYQVDEEGVAKKDEEGNYLELELLLDKYMKDLDDPEIKQEVLDEQVGEIEELDIVQVTDCRYKYFDTHSR